MIYYAVLFTAFFLFGFVIRNFRKVFHTLAENSLALVNELISAEEEDTKLSQVEKSTHKLVISMGSMFGVLILSFILTAVPFVMYILFTGIEFRNLDFSSFTAILVLSLGATLPFIIPGRKKRKTEYSELSQLLHRLALDNYNLAFKLFKWERRRRKKKGLSTRKDFVIVSGLARAGTTSLMNKLAEMDGFVSLSYANMPFLLCPNTWSRFYRPKSGKLKERSHKDGIMIGLNSNEALEEYFFKVKARDGYILPNALTRYHLPEQDYLDYLDYQSMVKRDPEKIYLAKNNNFLLRYHSMRSFNEEFLMVIMYRDPLTHASSLLEKHREYKTMQEEDPFVLEYMNWLGHHEFGQNQKAFVFDDSVPVEEKSKESLDYWLKLWIQYYQYVLKIDHPNTLLVNYEDYCHNPADTLKKILDRCGMDLPLVKFRSFRNRRKADLIYSPDLAHEALKIYNELGNKMVGISKNQ